jgi:hypothetical protein
LVKEKPLSFENRSHLVVQVEARAFDGVAGHNPRQIMVAAKNLSATCRYPPSGDCEVRNGTRNRHGQLTNAGSWCGHRETGRSRANEAAVNCRVEFKVVKVSAEAVTKDDFDF